MTWSRKSAVFALSNVVLDALENGLTVVPVFVAVCTNEHQWVLGSEGMRRLQTLCGSMARSGVHVIPNNVSKKSVLRSAYVQHDTRTDHSGVLETGASAVRRARLRTTLTSNLHSGHDAALGSCMEHHAMQPFRNPGMSLSKV